MTAATERDDAVRSDVLAAVDDGRLMLAYQPILDLRRGGVWGFEALVRLTRRDGTVSVAADFVAAAVQGGYVQQLGHAVLDRLAADLPVIVALTDARVSINLSAPETVDTAIVDRLTAGDLSGFADRLVVEVTEQTAAVPGALESLDRLRAAGVTIAVDDFGTGASDRELLVRTRPGVIKVDGSLTAALGESGSAAAVMRAALSLAGDLDCVVVAEGVETPRQHAMLPTLGVQLGQGYVLGRPVSPARRAPA